MPTQYQRVDHHNVLENENTNHLMKSKQPTVQSSSRMPLRAKQLNTEHNTHNKIASSSGASKGPSVSKSSRAKKRVDEIPPPLEIEELRRKPNGEGHTVHRYHRGKMLGKGGFAKVYTCTSMDTNRTYAVKIVPKTNLVKARARQKVSRL